MLLFGTMHMKRQVIQTAVSQDVVTDIIKAGAIHSNPFSRPLSHLRLAYPKAFDRRHYSDKPRKRPTKPSTHYPAKVPVHHRPQFSGQHLSRPPTERPQDPTSASTDSNTGTSDHVPVSQETLRQLSTSE